MNEEEKSGSEVGGRRDQERCEEEEGGILSPHQSATGEPPFSAFFLLISLSCASTSALRPSVRLSSIRELEEADVSFGGALSLSLSLSACVGVLARPASLLFLFSFLDLRAS